MSDEELEVIKQALRQAEALVEQLKKILRKELQK